MDVCSPSWLQVGVTHWVALAAGAFLGMCLCALFTVASRSDRSGRDGDRTP